MLATAISSLALIVSACSLVVSYFAWRSKEQEREPRLWVRFERFDEPGWWLARVHISNPSLVGLAPQELRVLSGGIIGPQEGPIIGASRIGNWQLSDRIKRAPMSNCVQVAKQGEVNSGASDFITVIVKAHSSPVRFRLDCKTVEAEPKRRCFRVVGHLPP